MSKFNPIPKISWTVNTGQTIAYPLIVGNQVIVNGSNQLQAYNASNGNINWSVNAGGPPLIPSASGPAYDNGMIFINRYGSGTVTLSAYNAMNGAKTWDASLMNLDYGAPVTAGNGRVYTAGAGSQGYLQSVRESDGLGGDMAPFVTGDNSDPTVANGSVYVSYEGPHTFDVYPSIGATLWQYSGPYGGIFGGGGVTSVYYNNRLYISDVFSYDTTYNQLVALDANTGKKIYDAIPGKAIDLLSPPAFFGGSGYVVLGNELIGFNAGDGSIIWSQALDGNRPGEPLVINGYVYEETAGGNLFVLNGASGAVVDELYLGSSAPTVTGSGWPFYDGMAASDGILAVPVGQNLVVLSLPEPTGAAGLLFAAALLLPRRRYRNQLPA